MKTLSGAVAGLQALLATTTLRVHAAPPESLSEFPAAIVYPAEGELFAVSRGLSRDFHVLSLDIYLSRVSIADATTDVQSWISDISALLKTAPKLSGTVDAIEWPVRYRVGPMQYAQQILFGVRFLISVKINSE